MGPLLIVLGAAILLAGFSVSLATGLKSAPNERAAKRGCIGGLIGLAMIIVGMLL